MTIWDDRILEYIRKEGASSAAEMKDVEHFRVSRSTISRRLGVLKDHGMLEHLGNGVYTITELGERYLDEELDAGELPGEGEADESAQA
jgi:DeoR/GlpR family transcriptional regulator of sugar metabolism